MTSRRVTGVLAGLVWLAAVVWGAAVLPGVWVAALAPVSLVGLFVVLVLADMLWSQLAGSYGRVGGLGSAAAAGFSGSAGRPTPRRVHVGMLPRGDGGRR